MKFIELQKREWKEERENRWLLERLSMCIVTTIGAFGIVRFVAECGIVTVTPPCCGNSVFISILVCP
jgi:hypothetical protein